MNSCHESVGESVTSIGALNTPKYTKCIPHRRTEQILNDMLKPFMIYFNKDA